MANFENRRLKPRKSRQDCQIEESEVEAAVTDVRRHVSDRQTARSDRLLLAADRVLRVEPEL